MDLLTSFAARQFQQGGESDAEDLSLTEIVSDRQSDQKSTRQTASGKQCQGLAPMWDRRIADTRALLRQLDTASMDGQCQEWVCKPSCKAMEAKRDAACRTMG